MDRQICAAKPSRFGTKKSIRRRFSVFLKINSFSSLIFPAEENPVQNGGQEGKNDPEEHRPPESVKFHSVNQFRGQENHHGIDHKSKEAKRNHRKRQADKTENRFQENIQKAKNNGEYNRGGKIFNVDANI